VLGPVELVDRSGNAVPLGGPGQVLLLAVLASEVNRPISAARLIELLWPERVPDNPTAALQSGVSRLRRALRDTSLGVQHRGQGYQLSAPTAGIDALVFQDRVAAADGDPGELAGALELWAGEPYLGLHHLSCLRHEAARLTDLKLSALEKAAGDLPAAEAVPYLRRVVAEAPLRERARVELMRALAASGQSDAAMAEYADFRTQLAARTGLEPSGAVLEAYHALLSGGGSPADPPPRRSPPLSPTPVPEPISPIVGRERELADLADLVARGHRLITLTGAGGVGKTRLAVEVARTAWSGPAAFVDLARVASPDDAADAIARSFGVHLASPDPLTDLAAGIADHKLIAVFDNFEHVQPAGRLLYDLLSRCAGLHAVVTSRDPLDVPAQTRYTVGPLAVPAAGAAREAVLASPSVALFLDRIADRSIVDGVGADAVGRLCRELGGLPLAVELAAGMVRTGGIDDLLHSPSMGEGSAVHAAIRWSYDRLPPADRTAPHRLAVFAGSFDTEAARALGAGPSTLEHLRERGLLTAERGRYTMPKVVALYLDARPDATAEAAHLRHYAGLCRDPRWLDDALLARVETEYAEIRLAVRRGQAAGRLDAELGDLAVALLLYWLWGGSTYPATRLLDELESEHRLPARLRMLRGAFLRLRGTLDEAATVVAGCLDDLAAAGDTEWEISTRMLLAALAYDRGGAAEAAQWTRTAIDAATREAPGRLPELYGVLAVAYIDAGETDLGARTALRALELLAGVDSPAVRAATRVNAAHALVEAGRGVLALEILTGGAADLADSPDGLLDQHINLGWAYLSTGRLAEALAEFRAPLATLTDDSQWPLLAELLGGCACALAQAGEARTAGLLLGGAESLLSRFDLPLSRWVRRQLDSAYATVVTHPHGDEWVQSGRHLGTPAVVRLAGEA